MTDVNKSQEVRKHKWKAPHITARNKPGSSALDCRMIRVDNLGEVIEAGQQHAVVLELLVLQILEVFELLALRESACILPIV